MLNRKVPTCFSKVSQKLDYDGVTWKKIKLSRSPPQPRESVTSKKDITDPFHIPTDWTVSHLTSELDIVTSKKPKLIRSTSQQTEPFPIWPENSTLLHRKTPNSSVLHPNRLNRFPSDHRSRRWYIEKNKTEAFHIATDWTVFHLSRELDAVTLKKNKSEPFHITTDRTIPSWLSNRKHSSS